MIVLDIYIKWEKEEGGSREKEMIEVEVEGDQIQGEEREVCVPAWDVMTIGIIVTIGTRSTVW